MTHQFLLRGVLEIRDHDEAENGGGFRAPKRRKRYLQPSLANSRSGSETIHYAANQVLCRLVLVNIKDLAAVLADKFGGLSIE